MGKLTDSLLSGSYGRIGRLVVANVNGTEILKHRPKKHQKTTNTKQLLIQERMTACYDFLSNYKAYASKYFGKRIGMRSPYNMAMSSLLLAFKLDYATSQIIPVYPEIAFSKGKLPQAIPTGLSSATPGTFTLQWFNNSGGNLIHETDLAQILYCPEGEINTVLLENVATRVDGTFQTTLPPGWSGKTIHVWMAYVSENNVLASNSAYAGSIEIA
jgi:hypothetical protein